MSPPGGSVYLAHTAHWQLLGLMVGCSGWILTMVTAGLNEWRRWYVSDVTVVTSGLAWVGIWKACFYSHALPTLEVCRNMGISEEFVPLEISMAQVLVMLAVVVGLAGNVAASFAMRNVYHTVENRDNTRLLFSLAGTLYMFTAWCSLLPLFWNMSSVLTNRTIDFPPEFQLPSAPVRQEVGYGIGVGIFASVLVLVSGLLFLCYKVPNQALTSKTWPITEDKDAVCASGLETVESQGPTLQSRGTEGRLGRDNPTFQAEEDL
ncbi:claudin-34-like [Hypomesus transpacificus]|uniref:claudin-34-like n=1 Tax=Hypomesus transpacificus TaxID=137520 RepID=UPI001F086B28|nr:claudin-34-like [Hypomesus transpacificus]